MDVIDVLGLDSLVHDRVKFQIAPRILILGTASRIDGDCLAGPDGSGVLRLFREEQAAWNYYRPLQRKSRIG